MDGERPEIYVLGGPNGSGKSTVARFLLPPDVWPARFVNADTIAAELTPEQPAASAIAAGRIMIRRLRELRARGERFAFETTLASQMFSSFLTRAKEEGYRVHLVYVSLPTPELAVERVQLRVRRGGHDIPEEVVRRRYARSLESLFERYMPLADVWTLCENAERGLIRVAQGHGSTITGLFDPLCLQRLMQQARTHGPPA